MSNPLPLVTERLIIRQMTPADAPFIYQLLNEPSFIRHIGDKGVRSEADAVTYIQSGPMASYATHNFGLYLVIRRADEAPMGICGLIKRDGLEHPDLGFAFRPAYWRQGYAYEASKAILKQALERDDIDHLLGITLPSNQASTNLLEKLGFTFKVMVRLSEEGEELMMYGL